MNEFFQKQLYRFAELMETAMAVCVGVAIVVSLFTFVPRIMYLLREGADKAELNEVLAIIFVIVIAIEFLKLLLKPDMTSVVEVLIFLIARHMIIEDTSPTQNLISILSICLLFLIENLLKYGASWMKRWKKMEDFRITETLHEHEELGIADIDVGALTSEKSKKEEPRKVAAVMEMRFDEEKTTISGHQTI